MSLDVHPIVHELTQARHANGAMNTATMTLVVFYETESIAGWVTERARAIADKHPSRVVLFDGAKDAGNQHAEPSVTRGEWIEIGCRGSEPHELRAALSMLELPEAPVVLAWIGNGIASDPRFVELARAADTVVVSTSVIHTDEVMLRELSAFVAHYPDIVVQDIAYLRLAAWQELIADFFDEPAFLEELLALCEVEVTAGSDPEMYYLLGWLASRLKWTPCDEREFCNISGDMIRFRLVHDGPPRRLSCVVLKSNGVTFTARVYPDDDSAVCLEVTGAKPREERCAPLHTLDIASLIERAILRNTPDTVFLESLAMTNLMIERKTS